MTAAVGKYAAKKILGSQLKKYQNREPAGKYVRLFTLNLSALYSDRS